MVTRACQTICPSLRQRHSEFTTSNGARIDTLGLDENGYPVILEYKRSVKA